MCDRLKGSQYIKAATNLYGVVPMQKIVEIYNNQNDDAITLDDLKQYSTEALKKESVYAKDGYFAHQAIDDIETMLAVQGNTAYYVPAKVELLRYVHRPPYEECQALFCFVKEDYGARTATQFCEEMFEAALGELTFEDIRRCLDHANIRLTSREQIDELLQLVVELANHIRRWEYRGHTRMEMGKALVLGDLVTDDNPAPSIGLLQLSLWIITVMLWASLRNAPMTVLAGVLLWLHWSWLPRSITIIETHILSTQIDQDGRERTDIPELTGHIALQQVFQVTFVLLRVVSVVMLAFGVYRLA